MKRHMEEVVPVVIAPARFVRIGPISEAATGITEKAQHQKINAGVWTEGDEWVKGPDGRRYLDLVGYNAWVSMTPPRDERAIVASALDVIGDRMATIRSKAAAGATSHWIVDELAELESLVRKLQTYR